MKTSWEVYNMKKPIHNNRRMVTIIFAGFATMILVTGCSSKDKSTMIDEAGVTPVLTAEAQLTPTPTPLAMTPAPGVTMIPTPDVTPQPTAMPLLLTQQEAEQVLIEKIDTSKYAYELIDEELNIDGKLYYRYLMFEDEKVLEPSILVDRETGILYCYDSDGNISAFTKFPLDNVEIIESGEHEITQESALNLLKKVTAQKLGLVNNLSHYIVIADEWTTVVDGDICYCFNVFEGGAEDQLVGMYYVSTSGKDIYKFDDNIGEFVKIN